MFCSNCFTERCISIPRSGLKLDLSLGLHSLPLWSSSPLLFSRPESFSFRWRRGIVSQAGQSGKSSSGAAVKSKNSIWRRDTVHSTEQAVEKVAEKGDTSTQNRWRKDSTPASHAGEDADSSKRISPGKSRFSSRDSFGYLYKRESSSGSRVESFRRVADNVSPYRNASVDSAWVADSWHNTHGGHHNSGRPYSNLTSQTSQKTSSKQHLLDLPVQGKRLQSGGSASFPPGEMNGQVGSLKRPSEEQNGGSNRRRKKKKYAPESEFRRNLDMCSKYGDLLYALDLYDQAIKEGTLKLDQYAYNVLLYLCSSAALGSLKAGKSGNDKSNGGNEALARNGAATKVESSTSDQDLVDEDEVRHTWNLTDVTDEIKLTAQRRGFEIYKHMQSTGVTAGEPTLTSVARLAVAVEDGDLAFEVIKEMSAMNIAPKLRSYGPALFTYCKLQQVEKAFEVYAHMNHAGVQPEEDELRALLQLSVSSGLEDKVYVILHRLRRTSRELSRATVEVFNQWFTAKGSGQVGRSNGDRMPTLQDVQQAIEAGGGGWHGLGWLGKGHWKTEFTTIDKTGRCRCCNEQLITIDIDPRETESFAESLAKIALSREARADFKNFQAWLDCHGPYDAIVDAANVGLLNQNFSEGGFNFVQVNAVVNGIQQLSPSKRLPLIVLHHKRTKGGAAATPTAQQFLQSWRRADTIFTTPTGSNDDWYWLYAAVKYKCLLVTNDEMRDHLFQLLGNDFFPKWKERHQVRFSISKKDDVEFHMPPPYSIVTQESETGAYHFPVSGGDDIAIPREWLCVTRPGTLELETTVELENLAEEGKMEESVPSTGDPLQPSTKLGKEISSEQSLLQAGELKHAALLDEGPVASFRVEALESSSLLVESLESSSLLVEGLESASLQVESLESASLVTSYTEEETTEVKSPKKAKSPRSPRTPRSATKNSDAPEAVKTKGSKSPGVKTKKSPDSPTLKLIKLAEKKATSPIDFQI